jgi:alpha-ketoglutarate-dependent taurine dioxygenase
MTRSTAAPPTAEKLGATVGAQVLGVDFDRLLSDDTLPAWTLDALEANGALVFRDLHIDDATQVAFSKKLGRVEVFGKGEHPEIFRVTLDPTKNRAAPYLRGTFDWHIDGMTEDIPIMATLLSGRAVATTGGQTEFASTYAGTSVSSTRSRPRSATWTRTPRPRRWRCGGRGRPRCTPSCGAIGPAGARSY